MLIPEDQIWMVVVGFIVAFLLAFGIGANDVANSFGTSVGAKVLTLRQACVLATICELSGAILLGSKVANTIRKGIVDVDMFVDLENGPAILMVGQVASLCGSCVWLLVATFFRLPVSGTHSIVGATVGFSLVVLGIRSVKWIGLVKI
ncbi:phosphate transporter family protein, partial [Opisthorchis viverrini]